MSWETVREIMTTYAPDADKRHQQSGQKLNLTNPRASDGLTQYKLGLTNTTNWHATYSSVTQCFH